MTDNPVWGDDWSRIRALWALDHRVAHCNHGSFGATPIPVLDEQREWQLQAQRNPVKFFARDLTDAVDTARDRLADYVGADPADSALVPNATTATATIFGSLDLEPGDEVLLSSHGYGAVSIAATRLAKDARASLVVADIPIDADDDAWVDGMLRATSERTRIAVVDHITSPTARLLPVERLVHELHQREVMVVVDAAHGPGLVSRDVAQLGADFWFGNFHKWAYAPPGTALLATLPEHRERMRSLVVSWTEDEGFPRAAMANGTTDLSAWLAAPRGLAVLDQLGPTRLALHNRRLAAEGQKEVADAIGADLTGLDDVPLPMRVIPLPQDAGSTSDDATALQARIAEEAGVETGLQVWNGRLLLRISAQAYNRPADYERLAAGLPEILAAQGAA